MSLPGASMRIGVGGPDTPSIVDEAGVLRADPRGAEPSELPGVTVAELAEMFENLRWFARLTVGQKLEAGRRARAFVERFQPPHDGDAG